MIEICAVGGYNSIGKNMTAIKIDNEVVIIDMGIHLDNYIKCTEDEEEDIIPISASRLLKAGAIPDDSVIDSWRPMVKAIIPTHAHLDHVGALIFLANKYHAPIFCTPFTTEIIRAISRDEEIRLKPKIKTLMVNAHYKLSEKISIEFISMTHSTPQTVMVALHTRYGIVLYANDFKFDNHPVIGKKPDYNKLEELGKKGILALICDSTRALKDMKTPSELVAREMLKDVLIGTQNKDKAIIVTTFSSHLARLQSIVEFGKKLNRKIVFLGRSLAKYVHAAERVGIVNFSQDVEIVKFGSKIRKKLKHIMKDGKGKYLLVVTGHQGEPKATLSKMARKELPFHFDAEDHIVFSCNVIPSPINISNRELLEEQLRHYHVRIFKDIHVSGHASREDLRDFLNLAKPRHLVPAHGYPEMKEGLANLAIEKGYTLGKTVHLIHDGEVLKI